MWHGVLNHAPSGISGLAAQVHVERTWYTSGKVGWPKVFSDRPGGEKSVQVRAGTAFWADILRMSVSSRYPHGLARTFPGRAGPGKPLLGRTYGRILDLSFGCRTENRYEMAFKLVSGADFRCILHPFSSLNRSWQENGPKPKLKFRF